MCGIFAYLGTNPLTDNSIKNIIAMSQKIKHRGPDASKHINVFNNRVILSFHRLKIVDLSDAAMQPSQYKKSLTLCNGEIYNYITLKRKYGITTNTNCDTEIVGPLIEKIGIYKACEVLDGVFAFIHYDDYTKSLYVGRDPFGLRSLYYGIDHNGHIIISSEMKSIPSTFKVYPFKNGCYSRFNMINSKWSLEPMINYYHFEYPLHFDTDNKLICRKIKNLLEEAVTKRMMSNRPIGCLLSGGLDSSIIASILAKKCKIIGTKLKTFSIGLKGAPDLKYAKIVADYLGTDHTNVEISEEEMFSEIEKDIYQIESYDTTTIRASTPMFILCKYIKKNTDIAVLFSGEGSDEASGSYMYFHNAPNPKEFQKETIRLLKDLPYFDVLRCDKSTAGAGLEVRVPFLDQDFINYYMGIKPELKMPNGDIEKRLLRLAFKDMLPNEIVFRVKEAFSDGVSNHQKSWAQVIDEKIKLTYKEDNLTFKDDILNPPQFLESKYYRTIFNQQFNLGINRDDTIPYYWLPKWSGSVKDPSARILNVYNTKESNLNNKLNILDNEDNLNKDLENKDVSDDTINKDVSDDTINKDVSDDTINEDVSDDNLNEDVSDDNLNEDVSDDTINKDVSDDTINKDVSDDNLNEDVSDDNLNEDVSDDNLNEDVSDDDNMEDNINKDENTSVDNIETFNDSKEDYQLELNETLKLENLFDKMAKQNISAELNNLN